MSSVTLDSLPGFYRRKLMLEFEPSCLLSTSEAASCVYIAHVLVFAVIFLLALNYEIENPNQTINIELSNPIDNPAPSIAAVVSPIPAALPPSVVLTDKQDYEVSFKKIFNGGKNIDSPSRQSAVKSKQTQSDEKSHLQLTKTAPPLPFKLPSPHYSKPSFSPPSPSLVAPSLQPNLNLSGPVEISATPSVLPLPELLALSPGASPLPVAGPLPQPVVKSLQLTALTPVLHNQACLQPDLTPVVVPMTESPLPVPLPAALSSARYEPPAPTSAVAQTGSIFAFPPNVPYRPTKSNPHEEMCRVSCGNDWEPYMFYLQTRIQSQCASFGGDVLLNKAIVVTFRLHKDGTISDLHLEHSNASTTLSDTALKAVESIAPFKALPAFADDTVDIQFTFNAKSMQQKCESDF